MHAVLITFHSTVGLDSLAGPFADYANALAEQRGLIAKTWLADGGTLGGFHLFDTAADADAYLGGGLFATVRGNPAFRDVTITRFDVVTPLSSMTNGLGGRAPTASVGSDG